MACNWVLVCKEGGEGLVLRCCGLGLLCGVCTGAGLKIRSV